MNYYLDVWRKYAVFDGRARGKEFWYFMLISTIVCVILEMLGTMLAGGRSDSYIASGLTGIYSLAVLLPSIAVTVRRLHDADKSGWLVLLGLIPIVGTIILFIICITPGTPGPNKYGPDPTAGNISIASAI